MKNLAHGCLYMYPYEGRGFCLLNLVKEKKYVGTF